MTLVFEGGEIIRIGTMIHDDLPLMGALPSCPGLQGLFLEARPPGMVYGSRSVAPCTIAPASAGLRFFLGFSYHIRGHRGCDSRKSAEAGPLNNALFAARPGRTSRMWPDRVGFAAL